MGTDSDLKRKMDELEYELEATKYFQRVIFAKLDVKSSDIEGLILALKNQTPNHNPHLNPAQTDALGANLLRHIAAVGDEIQEFLDKLNASGNNFD